MIFVLFAGHKVMAWTHCQDTDWLVIRSEYRQDASNHQVEEKSIESFHPIIVIVT